MEETRVRPPSADAVSSEDDVALLTRLNQRGFRLVQLADLLALSAIVVGTMWFRYRWSWPTYDKSFYFISFVVTVDVFLAALYFGGMYEREPRLGYPPALPRAMRQTLAAGGLVALLNLVSSGLARELGWIRSFDRALPMPVTNLVVLIVLGAAAVAANRRIALWLQNRHQGPPRVVLVGAPDDLAVARQHLGSDPRSAELVAELSSLDELHATIDETRATDVVLLSGPWMDSLYPDGLQRLERRGVTVLQRVTGKETMFGLVRVRQVAGLPFVRLRTHTMPLSRERFKRFTDLVMLAAVAPILVPLTGIVALYQLVVARRPILFWQRRVGAGGRTFRMVKFRTMRRDAEEDGNARLATQDDPRIIPACRWIRAMRLDELPQIYNVLRGEMSLVGPRPERPELTAEFEALIPGYSRRHEIPPGLTGLAQIHGRYHTDPEYKLGYDLQYLVNWSPVLDLEIVARTVWVVLARRI